MINSSDLMMLGWSLERKVGEKIVYSRDGYSIHLSPGMIQIYRTGLPCCLFQTAEYSATDLIYLMKGLKMNVDD